MKNSGLPSRVLAMSLLWLLPVITYANEEALGPIKAEAVEFKPGRFIDPLELLPIEVDGRWGFADRRGDVLIAPQYEWVDYFYGPFKTKGTEGIWFARYMTQGKMGWMRVFMRNNQQYRKVRAKDIHAGSAGKDTGDRYSDGLAVRQHGSDRGLSYHLSNPRGEWLNKVYYTGALRMVDGYSAVQIDGLCGFIDKRGKLVVPLEYAWVRSFREGASAVRQTKENGGAWGFIDKRGAFKFLAEADDIQDLRSYHNGLAAVNVKGKWGFLDRRRRPRIEPAYDEVRDFAGGCAAVRRGTEWGYVNVTGEETAWGFDGAWQFDDAARSGLTDNKKNSLEAPLGLIRQGGGYGYVSRTGRIQIEPRFDSALPFFRGAARVKCGESFAYIDPAGQPIWDPRRVTRFGILGIQSPPPVKPKWLGLPRSAGADRTGRVGETGETGRAGGEPFPFEYDVPDYLPLDLKPAEEGDKQKEYNSAESTADTQPTADEVKNEQETNETGSTNDKSKKRTRHVR